MNFQFDVQMNTAVILGILEGQEYSPGTGRKAGKDDKYNNERRLIEKELNQKNPIYGYRFGKNEELEMYGNAKVRVSVPVNKVTATFGDSWGRGLKSKRLSRALTKTIRENPNISDDELMPLVHHVILKDKEIKENLINWLGRKPTDEEMIEVGLRMVPYIEIQFEGVINREDIVSVQIIKYEDVPSIMQMAHECIGGDVKLLCKKMQIPLKEEVEDYFYFSQRGALRWGHIYDRYISERRLAEKYKEIVKENKMSKEIIEDNKLSKEAETKILEVFGELL